MLLGARFPVVLRFGGQASEPVVAECPVLPGCRSAGADREIVLADLRARIRRWLETHPAREVPGAYEVVMVSIDRRAGDA
jgi:predicted RNase H-like HicB family nuclease